MLFNIRCYVALVRLGVNPLRLPRAFRYLIRSGLAREYACTPFEAVLIVVSQLRPEVRRRTDPRVASMWASSGKLRLARTGVQEALFELRWDYLIPEGLLA